MFGRIVQTALLAGLLAGLFAWGAHMAKTTPLILAAEVYENAPAQGGAGHSPAAAGHAHGPATPATAEAKTEATAWEPEDGLERNLYTLLADVIAGIGFAFMLTGAIALSGREVDTFKGAVWGLAGFAAVYVAPSFGLAPELPGMQAADLTARQAWWLLAAAGTAAGLGLAVFAATRPIKAAGGLLILLPHLIGAPKHPLEPGRVPAELAAEFAVATLVVTGLFWLVLGGLTGYLYRRFERA
jgi:cobalt transporter subunit CbtA